MENPWIRSYVESSGQWRRRMAAFKGWRLLLCVVRAKTPRAELTASEGRRGCFYRAVWRDNAWWPSITTLLYAHIDRHVMGLWVDQSVFKDVFGCSGFLAYWHSFRGPRGWRVTCGSSRYDMFFIVRTMCVRIRMQGLMGRVREDLKCMALHFQTCNSTYKYLTKYINVQTSV